MNINNDMIAAAMWHSMQQAKRNGGQQPTVRYKRSNADLRRDLDRRIINWFKKHFG